MRLVIFAFSILIATFTLSTNAIGQNCKFSRSGQKDGAGGHVLNEMNAPSVSILAGIVLDPADDPIPGSVVVVKRILNGKATYVGTQITGLNGQFCFGGLRSGIYRLQNGHTGFNATWTTVNLIRNRRSLKNRKITVNLQIGT